MTSFKDRYSFFIFDWDGTLMDSTGRIISSMKATARIAGLNEPSERAVKGIIGLSMSAVMDKLFPGADAKLREELIEIYRVQYVQKDKTHSPLFEGVLSLLDWLKLMDIPISIATGKARAGLDRVLAEVGLSDCFDYSICADEVKSKPHPDMVNRLLQDANKTQFETLILGDSIHDLRMANNAGVDSVAVTSGANSYKELSAHQPVTVLEGIGHLKQWLLI